jgi:hypothetical protein
MAHTHEAGIGGMRFHFPDAVAAVATVLFEDAGGALLKAERELLAEFLGGRVEVGAAAPTHVAGLEENFLCPHFEDDVGMGADEDPDIGDLTEEGIEASSVATLFDGIDPDEDGVHAQELREDFVCEVLVVDRGVGFQADVINRLRDALETVACEGGRIVSCAVAMPEKGYLWR